TPDLAVFHVRFRRARMRNVRSRLPSEYLLFEERGAPHESQRVAPLFPLSGTEVRKGEQRPPSRFHSGSRERPRSGKFAAKPGSLRLAASPARYAAGRDR